MNRHKSINSSRKLFSIFSSIFTLAVSLFYAQVLKADTSYYDLVFSNPVQSTNGNQANLGPYYSGLSYDFRNVSPSSGQLIDLRITVSVNNSATYGYVGSLPNFNASPDANDGDLGVYFQYTANSVSVPMGGSVNTIGGIDYIMTFYVGDGTFSEELTLSNFRLLLYDVDGEASQSESVIAYNSDGFSGYQLGKTSNITYTSDEALGAHKFTGPGANRDERDASGAFILHFENTSSIRLTFESDTTLTSQSARNSNGVFSGIDGDLSLIDESEFDVLTNVPEPSSALLVLASCLCWGVRLRSRRY